MANQRDRGETGARGRAGDTDGGIGPGTTLGRYVVLERIGAGGMGVVFAAWDRELDRKVALKVLHGPADGAGRERLLHEARAMAKLAHPNVVTVHDVGEHDGRTFLAMEFVEGVNLGRWLAMERRPWRDVLGVFLQAGQGLAAAHRAGLVHRDFKPGNVLVGDDGRVRVVDFGLASLTRYDEEKTRPIGGSPARDAAETPRSSEPVTGMLAGTPRYMAPEQVLEGQADARADQFAFCVALYEALWGEHPSPDADGVMWAAGYAAGGGVSLPPAHGVPLRARRAVVRGLAPRREDRFPDMTALLAELAHDPAAVRRRWAAAGAVVALAGVLVFGAVELRRRRAALCSGGRGRLEAVWNPARKARIASAFAGTGLPGASVLADRAARALDAAGAHWIDCFSRACVASRLRGEVSAEVLDRQVACLELRLAEIDAFVSLLETADEALAVSALDGVRALPDPEPCTSASEQLVEDPLPADPVRRRLVQAVRSELARAEALLAAGRYGEAAEAARGLRNGPALESQPVLAAILLLEGEARLALGDADAAEPLLRKAVVVAERGGAVRVGADAAERMAWSLATVRSDTAGAAWWLDLASSMASRLSRGSGLQRSIETTRVTVLQQAGRYADALGLERRLYAEARETGRPADELATASEKLADVLFATGAYEEAIVHYREAIGLRERDVGPDHPSVADPLVSLGAALSKVGRDGEAVKVLERALSIEESVFGAMSPLLGPVLNNLAYVQETRGRYAEALATYDRTLEVVTAGWGRDHPQAGMTEINRTSVLRQLGRLPEALSASREAVRIMETSMGADHPYLAYALNSEGVILADMGRAREAVAAFERALRIREASLTDPLEAAETRFSLAKALCAAGERVRGRAEARRAREAFEANGSGRGKEDLALYREWIARGGCG